MERVCERLLLLSTIFALIICKVLDSMLFLALNMIVFVWSFGL